MRKILLSRAFTIIELLVIITIIGVLILGSTRINLSRLTQKQETGIELIQMSNIFEEIRNNALIGRGVGANLQNPDFWKIDISVENGGLIESFYSVGGVYITYENALWSARKNRGIMNLECQSFDGSSISSLSGTGSLIFNGDNIRLSGTNCDTQAQKVLFVRYGNANISETLTFNTLSGVIKRN